MNGEHKNNGTNMITAQTPPGNSFGVKKRLPTQPVGLCVNTQGKLINRVISINHYLY